MADNVSMSIVVPSDPVYRALIAASISTTAATLLPQYDGDKSKALAEALNLYMGAFGTISRANQPQAEQGATAENASA